MISTTDRLISHVNIQFSLVIGAPLCLQISQRSPWRQWHRVLFEREFCSIYHDLQELYKSGQSTDIDHWERSQQSIIRCYCSCNFKVTAEVYVDDQALRTLRITENYIDIFMFPCRLIKNTKINLTAQIISAIIKYK